MSFSEGAGFAAERVEAHVAAAIVNAENHEDDLFRDNIKV